jgi:hypothetical protein
MRPKSSKCVNLNGYVREYENVFKTDGTILYCNFCEKQVNADSRSQVTQHVATAKHIKCATLKKPEQRLLTNLEENKPGPANSEFFQDISRAFIAADIPLNKLQHPVLREILEKYTKLPIPDESTVRKNYLPKVYLETINKIRKEIGEHAIWVTIDETTDSTGRYVANVIVGTLNDDPSPSFLLTSECLEKTNNTTIAKTFNDSMMLLWPGGIQYDKVHLMISDAAPYMVKAGKGLKLLYSKMIHLTCLAHGVHRVAEIVRGLFPNVNGIISNVKKVFVKAPNRVSLFRQLAPGLHLPPQPILTRWGTWLDAACYYADNFQKIDQILENLDQDDAMCIGEAKKYMSKRGAQEDLLYIKANFAFLNSTITKLERKNVPLTTSIQVIVELCKNLNNAPGEPAKEAVAKLKRILSANPGYNKILQICGLLSGEGVLDPNEEDFSLSDIANFKYAPVTSCDVERSFSQYKTVLACNRQSFVFENLKMYLVVHCNARV